MFTSETNKIFVDHIFFKGEIYMVIKTWQKIVVNFEIEKGSITNYISDLKLQCGLTEENQTFMIKTLQVFDKFGAP